jgi:hypothetical protein
MRKKVVLVYPSHTKGFQVRKTGAAPKRLNLCNKPIVLGLLGQ